MSFRQKLTHEVKVVALTTAFFAVWFGLLILIKELILSEYDIHFRGLSMAAVAALVLAKVVIILERVSLGERIQSGPALLGVVLRTGLYLAGAVIVLGVERAFEGRHEHGGFVEAFKAELLGVKECHLWANTVCLAGALLTYNTLTVIRRHLGPGGLQHMFLSPLPKVPPT